ncbi:hypothetical protein L3Q67_12420 [Saccharothrix sp. AJ9571]|nr:hypothetical protein L3Q67_12420 [Saccharothrix sp. AJ9571]
MIGWLPELEPAAVEIAVADEGVDTVAAMGCPQPGCTVRFPARWAWPSSPRAGIGRHRGSATVPRPAMYVRRKVSTLDVERQSDELGTYWVTTAEQTVLDLAARTRLGDLPDESTATAHALLPRADQDILEELAIAQRRQATLRRLLAGD